MYHLCTDGRTEEERDEFDRGLAGEDVGLVKRRDAAMMAGGEMVDG